MTGSLDPLGVHASPSGMTRYAIWRWSDAAGEIRIPCACLAAIDNNALITDAQRSILRRDGLLDGGGALTERGFAVLRAYRNREGVRAGAETPHGLRRIGSSGCVQVPA